MRSRQTTGQHALPSLVPVTGAVPPPGHRPPESHLPELQQALLAWFAANARPLPWRRQYTPYEVWISEIMLQQTQMERGVSYFLRWMERFPDLPALAAASEEEVLHAWEGLGYYSRARNLLAAARLVMREHGGIFPSGPDAIRALPGIGPYTAAAIASIAFNLPVACIDANVERVIARVFDVDSPVKSGPAAARIAELARRLLPAGEARRHNQAMMELGALVCGKKPRCGQCPLARFCTALHLGIVHERPVPGKKAEITPIEVVTGVLSSHGRIFVQKRLPQGAWGGLWEFPGGRVEPGETPEQAVVREFAEETGLAVRVTAPLGVIRHGYTTYRVRLHCFALEPVADAPPPLPATSCVATGTPSGSPSGRWREGPLLPRLRAGTFPPAIAPFPPAGPCRSKPRQKRIFRPKGQKALDSPPVLSLYGCPKWRGSHCRIILMQNMRSQRGGLNRPPFFCTCDRADAQEGT